MTTSTQATPKPPTVTDPAIRLTGVSKRYGTLRALDGLDLQLPYGQVVGLLGENGCGKTTLLKVLAGILSGYQGDAHIAGLPPGPASKAKVSYLPDQNFLPPQSSVRQCIKLYRDFFEDFDEAKATDLIRFFGLNQEMHLKQMSKGMREKVQIALVMSRRARVYLLDEPISGVDSAARDVILDALVRNLDQESLVLVSTHLIHDLEPILDAVVMMRAGQVLLMGQVDDLRSQHGKSMDQLFKEVYRWPAN